jgi:hypothetical protein
MAPIPVKHVVGPVMSGFEYEKYLGQQSKCKGKGRGGREENK